MPLALHADRDCYQPHRTPAMAKIVEPGGSDRPPVQLHQ
jgi:hypothetical protein